MTDREFELLEARNAYADATRAVNNARDALQIALARRLAAGVRVGRLRAALRKAGLEEGERKL